MSDSDTPMKREATREEVRVTAELRRRARRAPALALENRVLHRLAAHLTEAPADLLQEVVDAPLRFAMRAARELASLRRSRTVQHYSAGLP